jgi:hypothetical protein
MISGACQQEIHLPADFVGIFQPLQNDNLVTHKNTYSTQKPGRGAADPGGPARLKA